MHANAAGIGILDSNIPSLLSYANEGLKNIDFNEGMYEVQFIRDASDYDIPDMIFELSEYDDMWGTDIPEPKTFVRNIQITPSNIKVMGRYQDSLKISCNGVDYVKFHAKEMIQTMELYNWDTTINIVGRGNLNNWNGRYTPQMFIEDYEIAKKDESILSF